MKYNWRLRQRDSILYGIAGGVFFFLPALYVLTLQTRGLILLLPIVLGATALTYLFWYDWIKEQP